LVKEAQKKYGISITENNFKAMLTGDFVFINVLPYELGDVVTELKQHIFPRKKLSLLLPKEFP
jgi:pyrroline-5-carboxylate reductase